MSTTMAGRRITQPERPGPAPSDKALGRVRDRVTGGLPPELRPEFWRQFMQMPMANCACQLLSLLEPQDDTREPGLYQRRSRRPAGAGLFEDIPCPEERARAEEIFSRLCQRHAERLASCRWLRPVLAERARSMAAHPEAQGPAWGARMRRSKGGRHAQDRYRKEGWHPLPSVRRAKGWPAKRPQ
jgi:hypothetical protein